MNQRGRKPKAAAAKRSFAAWIRMTEEEAALLKERSKAAKLSQAAYLRSLLMGMAPVIVPEPNQEKYSETARWAAALSQLAKHLNAGEVAEDLLGIRALLSKFRAALLGISK